jgi:hypothetical protein
MGKKSDFRARLVAGGSLVAAAALLSGCIDSPTYGTGKSANSQLMSDMSGILSFRAKAKPPIDYAPRPELVKPAKREANLPAPQDSVATAGNPNWPESPEARNARLRADITANQDNPNYNSPIVSDVSVDASEDRSFKKNGEAWRAFEGDIPNPAAERARKAEYERRSKETQQGSSTTRKFLSEPPIDYRQASAAAPVGELGEDEATKERRLKSEARKKGGGFSLEDLNPF